MEQGKKSRHSRPNNNPVVRICSLCTLWERAGAAWCYRNVTVGSNTFMTCAYLRTFKQRAIFLQFPYNDLRCRIACPRY